MSKRTFSYQIQPEPTARIESGELEAKDIEDAKRQLRVKFLLSTLPDDTSIIDLTAQEENRAREKSAKARELLRVLTNHHAWLANPADGQRADLTGLNLSEMVMPNSNLKNADMAGVDLSGADLSGCDFSNANLVRSSLHGANLKNANLSGADLSDADLRGAILTGAELTGADLWRANLMGCVISPTALHKALGCKTK